MLNVFKISEETLNSRMSSATSASWVTGSSSLVVTFCSETVSSTMAVVTRRVSCERVHGMRVGGGDSGVKSVGMRS